MASSLIQTPQSVSLDQDPIWIIIETDEITSGTPDQENLSCYVEVWDATLDEKMVSLNASYDLITKRCEINLRSILNLSPALPTESSIVHNVLGIEHGETSENIMKYKIKHADKYGSPATIESLDTSSDYYVIHGGRSKGSSDFSPMSGPGIGLHKYRGPSGNLFEKPLTIDQPEWLYFFNGNNTDFEIKVTFYYTDGTNESVSPSAWDFNAVQYTIHWIHCGYRQLDLGNYVDPGKTLYKYKVEVIAHGLDLVAYQEYKILEDYHDHVMHLMVPNGFGGCESVRMRGKRKLESSMDKEFTDQPEWIDTTIQSGTMSAVNQFGTNGILLNTGFHSEEYIFHLRQILRGDVWLVNLESNRFEKYKVTTSSIVYKDDDEQLFSFEIELESAFFESNFNNW